MPSLRGLQRILFIIVIVGAATGLKRQQQQQQQQQIRDHYEIAPAANLAPQLQDYTPFSFQPYAFAHYTPSMNEQYVFQQPTHSSFQHFPNIQKGNGNSLAATEIAMEILRDTFPSNIENPYVAANEYYELPLTQKNSFDFMEKEHNNNFRRSNVAAAVPSNVEWQAKQEKLLTKNSNCHENPLNCNDNDDATSMVNDDWSTTRINYGTAALDINNETAPTNDEYALSVNTMKPPPPQPPSNLNAEYIENFDGISRSPIILRSDTEPDKHKENLWQKITMKRNPLAIDRTFAQPHYPYAFFETSSGAAVAGDKRNRPYNAKLRSTKRERLRPQKTTFVPSISTNAMAHLGHFFNDLSNNVRYNERNDFREAEAKILHGDHPLGMLQSDVAEESNEQSKIDKTAEFLHAIRSYRPSQKIRSLVSMNPQGYHGSNFLDPNYMWVGLG